MGSHCDSSIHSAFFMGCLDGGELLCFMAFFTLFKHVNNLIRLFRLKIVFIITNLSDENLTLWQTMTCFVYKVKL